MNLRDHLPFHELGGVTSGTALVLVIALLVAACGGDPVSGPTSAPATTVPATAPTTTPPTAPPTTAALTTAPPTTAPSGSAPATVPSLDARIEWVLAAVNDPTLVTDDAIAEQFAPDFVTQVGAEAIRTAIADAAATGAAPPWTVTARDGDATSAVVTLTDGSGATLTLQLAVEPVEPGRIVAALIQPGSIGRIEEAFADPGSRDEIDAALDALADRVVYGVYDTTDGGCAALAERDASTAAPTGSTFKLWVLATLARAVESGDASWDETVVLDPALRSSPDGEVYGRPDGTAITLRELAELMISISDNTATDMLIARLGRPAIERTMAELGLSAVERNTPFLSTADLFRLKFVDPALGDRYLALSDPEARRAFLDGEVASTPLPWVTDPSWAAGDGFGTPTRIDELEWFATPMDICTTMLDLDRLAATPGLEPVADILERNPGLPFPAGQWSTIRFKGGSEPGVVMFGYWLESPAGERRVVVLALSDPARTIADLDAATGAARLIGLAAEPTEPAAG